MAQSKKAEKGLPFFSMYLHKLEKKNKSQSLLHCLCSPALSQEATGYRSAEKMPLVQNHMV